jgi:hypothetical protein
VPWRIVDLFAFFIASIASAEVSRTVVLNSATPPFDAAANDIAAMDALSGISMMNAVS